MGYEQLRATAHSQAHVLLQLPQDVLAKKGSRIQAACEDNSRDPRLSKRLAGLSVSLRGKSTVPKSPKRGEGSRVGPVRRLAAPRPCTGARRQDAAPAPSGTSPGAVLTPRSPGHRRGHATGRAGCQQPANPALQGLYAVTSPGAARDIITTGLARRPCGSRHLPRYGRPGVTTPAQLPAPPHRRPAPGLPSVAQALTAACYDITR